MMPELEEDSLKIIAICEYDAVNGGGPAIEEAVSAAPGVAFQLSFTRGQILNVVGGDVLSWWLFVRGVKDQDEGYVPSAYFIPLRRDLTPKEFLEFMDGGSVPPSAINNDVNLRFFPDAPQERTMIGRERCPRERANLFSKLFFWWINGLIITGYKRALEEKDLWQLEETNRSSRLVPRVQQEWKKEQIKNKKSKKPKVHAESETAHLKLESEEVSFTVNTIANLPHPSLTKAFARVFGPFLLIGVLLKLCADIFMFIQPQLLSMLIDYVEDPSQEDWRGYVYMLCMVATAMLQYIFHQHAIHNSFLSGMRIGTSVMGLVYSKALSLSSTSRKNCNTGEIVNLMAIDAQRLVELIRTAHQLWSAPLQICTAIYFLYVLMGPSILAGVAVLLLLVPLNILITRISRRLQVKQLKHKDDRVKLIGEVLSGIKVLKLYAWEEAFMEKIMGIRKTEVGHLTNSMYLNASVSFTFICAPFLVSLATFTVYVMSGEQLTATKAFVAISLFNILRFPLAVFPRNIINLIQAQVSLSRLTAFLNLDEVEPDNVIHAMPAHVSSMAVHVQHGAFAWEKDEAPILENININVVSGSLVAVVGQVGCGKSTLLSALLGETEKLDGMVYVKGSTAYVPQQAWTQNATLQDNILFGKMMDKRRYKEVLRACALMPDIKILPTGDLTEIGEKGINLSGGQKQRVNLARAVYFNADVFLLDDPLSAVDSHVGKHIFDKVIGPNGMLKGRTRIMVTHGVQFLRQVDQIVVIQAGKISEVGTYAELLANQGAFAEFLNTYANGNGQEEAVATVRSGSTSSSIALADSPAAARKVMSCHHLQAAEELSPEAEASAATISGKLRAKSETHLPDSKHNRIWWLNRDGPGSPQIRPRYCRDISIQQSLLSLDSLGAGTELELSAEMNNEEGLELEEECLSEVAAPLRKVDAVVPEDEEGDAEEAGDTSKLTGGGDKTEHANENGKIISTERSQTGAVKFSVVKAYAMSVGLVLSLAILLITFLAEALLVSARIWLAEWSSANATSAHARDHYLGGYGGLGLANALGVLAGAFLIAFGSMRAAWTLHNNLLHNVLHCPMTYFETTPLGRIVNRFSRDMHTIDDSIPRSVNMFLRTLLKMFGTLFVISYSTPLFLTVVLPLVAFYILIQRVYVATSRQLRRLESVSRSPVYSHFFESLTGTSVIRAFRQQKRFILDSNSKVDATQMAYYPIICANRWLGLRLEFIGAIILFFAILFAVISRRTIPPGLVGLSIAYALQTTGVLTWLVRQTSEVETNIVAVERVKEYSDVKSEAAWIIPDRRPPAEWPQEGRIDVENLELRYRDDQPLVVNDLTFEIGSGEKVGIVGRTGAGKSTLLLALFRILERAGGRIVIDNIDITKIGLQDLRSRLTIIPQDAILFSGTLRLNLDPFDNYNDEELWRVLEVVHLKTFVSNLQEGLLHVVQEGGDNLSAGQRQLVCLARALLRKSKVLVLDEATAAVDLETDELIQNTIRTEFADRTVLTIAHRLNTIMDYSRIMVLDEGSIKEFDTPSILLARKQTFYQMAKDAGLA